MFQLLKKKTGRLTRVLRYIKRSREKGHIRPVHVSGAELKDRSNHYGGIVEDFVREMNACAETFEADFPRNERLTDYEILSFNGDRMGKVLRKEGEIYRGIYRESADDFREMWKTGLLQTLSAHGWIPETEISGYYTDEYPIILKHRTVDMNASKLWSYNMVREAAIRISLIQNIARRAGFTLHDGHMNNVTFHEGKPVFTDIGSFVKDRGQNTVCNREIVFSGCYRCVFRQLGNFMLSRNQTYDESNNMIWMTPRYYDDLTEEYVRYAGSGKYDYYFHYKDLRKVTVFEERNMIKVKGLISAAPVFVPHEDFRFVQNYILRRVPDTTTVVYR